MGDFSACEYDTFLEKPTEIQVLKCRDNCVETFNFPLIWPDPQLIVRATYISQILIGKFWFERFVKLHFFVCVCVKGIMNGEGEGLLELFIEMNDNQFWM